MNTQTPLVEMRDMHIAFGGIKAVDHVSVDLYRAKSWAFWAITAPENRP